MIATKLADASLVIVAVSSLVASLASAYQSTRNGHKIDGVKKEVTTMNGLTMAQLSDARESRRVDAIRPTERTEVEQQHLDVVDTPTDLDDPLVTNPETP